MGGRKSYKIEDTILYKELEKEKKQKEDINYICNSLDMVYSVLFILFHLEENEKLKGLYKELKTLLNR